MKFLKDCFAQYKGLPKSLYIVLFACVINNMGNFVGPFLTMFLTYKVGINVGIVGIIVAVNSALGMIGSMIGGKLIDEIGRKKILIIFSTATSICYGFCGVLREPTILTSLLMLASFLGGFSQPVSGTIITDLTDGEQRKAAFSLNYMALNIGFSFGPLLAGFLYEKHLLWLFWGDALTTILSIALIGIFVRETKPSRIEGSTAKMGKKEDFQNESLLQVFRKMPNLMFFSITIVFFFIVFSQFNFGLSLQIQDIFNGKGSAVFGTLMTINAVLCSTLSVFINSLTKNIKESLNIGVGGILYAIGFGMLFFVHSYPMLILSTVIWTIGEIFVSTNTSVYIANHTPASHRGRFNSVFPIIRRLGFMAGPIIAGFYVRYTNIRNLWIFIAGISLIGSLMIYRLYLSDNAKELKEAKEAVI